MYPRTLSVLFCGILTMAMIGCGGGETSAPPDLSKSKEFEAQQQKMYDANKGSAISDKNPKMNQYNPKGKQ